MRHLELGHLGVGAPADITVLRQVDSDYVFEDVVGATRQGSTLLQPVCVKHAMNAEVSPPHAPSLLPPPVRREAR